MLKGKIAIVTGAGAGIGFASALAMAQKGASVILAERDIDSGTAAEDRLTALGLQARFIETDVSDEDSMRAMIDKTVALHGGIDILYNNAGGSTARDGRITDVPFEEFWQRMRVDLYGVWLGCHYAIPHMQRRGGGAIINATSVLGMRGTPGKTAYSTAKGGVIALTRCLAIDYAGDQIRANAIAPGLTLTERVNRLLGDAGALKSQTGQRAFLGAADPEDVGEVVSFLASDAARKITGQVVPVDGGFTMS